GARRRRQGDARHRAERPPPAVAPGKGRERVGTGIAEHFEDALDEIHDPVVGDAGPGVKAALVVPVQSQARVADLDEQHGLRGMAQYVVAKAAGHGGHVRFWLGLVVQSQGRLRANFPARAERQPERFLHGPDGAEVAAALWLGDDELAADELDRLTRSEEAALD